FLNLPEDNYPTDYGLPVFVRQRYNPSQEEKQEEPITLPIHVIGKLREKKDGYVTRCGARDYALASG
ncbi:MAG: hypothetical protein KC413_19075, partial [Anaerolineales bacterium]|nr:hypothetical protein [Anaerolineales bacterium]